MNSHFHQRGESVRSIAALAQLSSIPKALFAIIAGVAAFTSAAIGQEFKDLQVEKTPLVLKAQGSFEVGGEDANSDALQGSPPILPAVIPPGGHHQVNQMYVRYMIPMASRMPVILIHGGTLTGKSYETTPDGRMGWDEYFVRKFYATYVIDQVGRGRSGFDPTSVNEVSNGKNPVSTLPNFVEVNNDASWLLFRFGAQPGVPYSKTQYPVKYLSQLANSVVPDNSFSLPVLPQTIKSVANLAATLKGAVLVGHSQTGSLPMDAALSNSKGVSAAVLMEPGSCNNTTYTDAQFRTLARIPILVIFADHIGDGPPQIKQFWQPALDDCRAFVKRMEKMNGKAQLVVLPEIGIRGNTHMLMQDKNNLQIADLIMKWIERQKIGTGLGNVWSALN